MKIPSIHVGCGEFSLQRLELLINGNQFAPIACVDIDVEKDIRPIFDQSKDRTLNSTGGLANMLGE